MRYIIAATDSKNGIGRNNSLPWNFLKEMCYFKKITSKTKDTQKQNAVIMGRKTWESIPKKFRPLKNRLNVVVSSSNINHDCVFPNVEKALTFVNNKRDIEKTFFIGGQSIYKEILNKNLYDGIYLTKIHKIYDCDTFFPELNYSHLKEKTNFITEENNTSIEYKFFEKIKNSEENEYLKLIEEIIYKGDKKPDRTGTCTRNLFGKSLRFDLSNGTIPLLTTKKVFWRGVAEELLWFISGCTNANKLKEKGIHIWDGNSSRNYLNSLGLKHREEGDLGPVYGHLWRHFGADYKNMHTNYENKGVDQLKNAIDLIKNNPNSRRIVVTAWNPSVFKEIVLPACHMIFQFYVSNGKLSCQMYQRSADIGLGVPFNIASYSLLTHLIAHCTGLEPGEFIHVLGDAHVYENHIDPLKEQLTREPRKFPTLKINTNNKNIDKFKYEDFEILNYNPHKNIKMKMAV